VREGISKVLPPLKDLLKSLKCAWSGFAAQANDAEIIKIKLKRINRFFILRGPPFANELYGRP
jgi:hypothetical protein